MKISVCLFNFSFCCLLNEVYSRVICSEEGQIKIAENVQRLKQDVFSNKTVCYCCYMTYLLSTFSQSFDD